MNLILIINMPKKVKIYVRLFDFKISDQQIDYGSDSDEVKEKPTRETVINMFGMNEKGKTFCLNVLDFKPFFYVKFLIFGDHRRLKNLKSN